jgi:hypothetical protein
MKLRSQWHCMGCLLEGRGERPIPPDRWVVLCLPYEEPPLVAHWRAGQLCGPLVSEEMCNESVDSFDDP